MTGEWSWLAASCLLGAALVAASPSGNTRARRALLPRSCSSGPRYARLRPLYRGHNYKIARTVPLVIAGAGAVGALLAGPVAGIAAGAYGGLAVRSVLRRRSTRTATEQRARSLDTLCALAADLRAGLPAATVWPSTGLTRRGGPDRLTRLARAAWELAEQTGAPLADLVERIEADARAMDRAVATAAAQAAGARATAWLLAALPLGGIGLGYGIGADPLHVLLHTPLGAGCALAAIALQFAGLAWTERLGRAPEIA